MLWFFVALLVAVVAVLYLGKRFAASGHFASLFPEFKFFSRATLILAGVLGMAGSTAEGGLQVDPARLASLRLVALDEPPHIAVQGAPLGLTGAGHQARSLAILSHRNDLAELREHIKYELRRGNITPEKATNLKHLVDEIELEASVDSPAGQAATEQEAQERTLVELAQSQAKLSETLADTKNLVAVLSSVSRPEFAGTFIAAKIQVVRLLAEKAAVEGSIDEIRQYMKRPKAG